MKKHYFFKALIALTVLSAILLSTFLGVTKAEYFKSLSKQIGLEIIQQAILIALRERWTVTLPMPTALEDTSESETQI